MHDDNDLQNRAAQFARFAQTMIYARFGETNVISVSTTQ